MVPLLPNDSIQHDSSVLCIIQVDCHTNQSKKVVALKGLQTKQVESHSQCAFVLVA